MIASGSKSADSATSFDALPGRWWHAELFGRLPVHVWPGGDEALRPLLEGALGPQERAHETNGEEPFEPGLVVLSLADGRAASILRQLRAREDTRLLPVGLLPGPDGPNGPAPPLADAVLPASRSLLVAGLLRLETVLERVALLPAPEQDLSRLERRELDFLRFLHSRGTRELAPVPDVSSGIGFRYPAAEEFLFQSPLEALQTLEELAGFEVFTTELVERVYLCPGCQSSRVTLREVCPGCRVPALVGQEVIHHFRCAHVGPSSTFQREGRLRCPKCEHELLHVGVDHDKPGIEQRCDNCKSSWLEGLVELRCLGCDVRVPPEQARLLDLPVFRAAPGLQRAAEESTPPLTTASKLLTKFVQPRDPAVFELFRTHVERVCRRFGRPASVITIELVDLKELQDDVGRHELRRMLTRFAQAIGQLVRNTDLVGLGRDDTLELILVETDSNGAEVVRGRLEKAIAGWGMPELPMRCSVRPLVEGAPA